MDQKVLKFPVSFTENLDWRSSFAYRSLVLSFCCRKAC